MIKQKLCILSFSKIVQDARVLREIDSALPHYAVDVIGHGPWLPPEGVRFFACDVLDSRFKFPPTRFLLLLGRFFYAVWEHLFWRKEKYRYALGLLTRNQYDLIHANDWDALPVAVTAARHANVKVLFDAHEYTPDQRPDTAWGRYLIPFRTYLIKNYAPHTDAMITVGEGIARLYQENFSLQSAVVMNAPHYESCGFRAVNPDRIELVYHGGAARGRSIEDFIKMMPLLESRYHLNLMLISSDSAYMKYLVRLAEQSAPGRLTFHSPVSPREIVKVISLFDIGIHKLLPHSLNHTYALPNKFFDYIMAGLGICVSPLPEMQSIVVKYDNGVVAQDQSVESMSMALNSLSTARINSYKRNSLELAKILNAETEAAKLLNIYQSIMMKLTE